MSYIEKITNLRRMALCYPWGDDGNGAIAWEGVDIENIVVLKKVSSPIIACFNLDEHPDELRNFAKGESLVIHYQDPKGEKPWEPRA